MSKKKKAGASVVRSAAQLEANALSRFKRASDLMIGPGGFERFNKASLAQLLATRVSAVKLRFKPGSLGEPDMLKYVQEIFSMHLNKLEMTTLQGCEIPVGLFLREGLGLIVYTGAMRSVVNSSLPELAVSFAAYGTPEWLTKAVSELVFLLHKMSIVLSDWARSIFVYSVNGLSAYNERNDDNVILAEHRRLESCVVRFDGQSRDAVRLSWSGVQGDVEYLQASPFVLGFKSVGREAMYDVYIQRHALQRLQERLGLNAGLIHHTIFELLKRDDLFFYRQGPSSLVRLSLWDKKLGYLVCGLFEEKVVIRSFLFVTNDGTPEGKRLSELTQLERLDKKYLGIDSLSGFLGMNVSEDPVLSGLFTEAGCSDLLDLSEIKMYYMSDVKERDPAKLLSYLMGVREKAEELVEG